MAKTSFIFLLLLVAFFFDTSEANPCSWGNFHCSRSNQCKSSQWRCDGERDCTYGEDELNCRTACSSARLQFRCNNYKCIRRSYVCDGDNDCGDFSDESSCLCGGRSNAAQANFCSWGNYNCSRSNQCKSSQWRCNGNSDCSYGEDELNCRTACSGGQFRCTNDKCILRSYVCDGYNDCGDFSDESSYLCGIRRSSTRLRCYSCRTYTGECSSIKTCPFNYGQGYCYWMTAWAFYKGKSATLTEAGCRSRCTPYDRSDLCRHQINCELTCCATPLCKPRRLRCYSCSASSSTCSPTTCAFNYGQGYCYWKTTDRTYGDSTNRVTIAGCKSSCTSRDISNACSSKKNCEMECCSTPLCKPPHPSCYTCSSSSSYEDCEKRATLTTCTSFSASCYKMDYKMSSSQAEVSVYKKGCTVGSNSCSAVESTYCSSSLTDKCNVYCCTGSKCNAGSVLRFNVITLLTCVIVFFIL